MENTNKNHKIICEDRNNLQMTGIEKVESSNENQIVCASMKSVLIISGKNLHVKKLNVEDGHVEIIGQIDSIKYQQEKKPLLKRIFK